MSDEWAVDGSGHVGPIRIGMARSQLSDILGDPPKTTTNWLGYPTRLDYIAIGVRTTVDAADVVREIEVFAPATLTAAGQPLLGLREDQVRSALAGLGCEVRRESSDSLVADACGLRVWLPSGVVESILAFDTEDEPPPFDKEDVLRRMGITPQR